jgi:hypothetical protein
MKLKIEVEVEIECGSVAGTINMGDKLESAINKAITKTIRSNNFWDTSKAKLTSFLYKTIRP